LHRNLPAADEVRPGADGCDIPFSAPTHELASSTLTAVDRLALADEDSLAPLIALEALVLCAKSHVNASNQPQKCWSSIRLAITVGTSDRSTKGRIQSRDNGNNSPAEIYGSSLQDGQIHESADGLAYAVNDKFDERVARQVLHSPSHIQTQMRALRRW
jgi:hypothetical protein